MNPVVSSTGASINGLSPALSEQCAPVGSRGDSCGISFALAASTGGNITCTMLVCTEDRAALVDILQHARLAGILFALDANIDRSIGSEPQGVAISDEEVDSPTG